MAQIVVVFDDQDPPRHVPAILPAVLPSPKLGYAVRFFVVSPVAFVLQRLGYRHVPTVPRAALSFTRAVSGGSPSEASSRAGNGRKHPDRREMQCRPLPPDSVNVEASGTDPAVRMRTSSVDLLG
jgi:hypothetical protein